MKKPKKNDDVIDKLTREMQAPEIAAHPERKPIREEDAEHEKWYEAAPKQTLETLSEFLRHLMTDYVHDYGTVCHALAAGAVATAWAMNHHENGGITGFQSGAVLSQFVAKWGHIEGPWTIRQWDRALYPQYESSFATTIPPAVMKWLKDEAKKKLKAKDLHPDVKKHMQSVAAGDPPFGYSVREE